MRAALIAAALLLASCEPVEPSLQTRVEVLEKSALVQMRAISVMQDATMGMQERELARLKAEPIVPLAICNSTAALYRDQCLDVTVGESIGAGASISTELTTPSQTQGDRR
jgi:hypothetical protein